MVAIGSTIEEISEDIIRQLKSELCLQYTILSAIKEALDGDEPSDFMLSFPVVRQVWDLVYELKKYEES